MLNKVTVSGMFGAGKTYFADSPVVIDISGLKWPGTSPFNIVRVEVVYDNNVVGEFKADTGGQTSISFDILSALRAIWSDYDFGVSGNEVTKANAALTGTTAQTVTRGMRKYSLRIYTEYLSSDDGGVFTVTQCEDENGNTDIPGGQCMIGGLTEWERSLIVNKEDADSSHWEDTNLRNGDASTKPTESPERVGRSSVTSWVDVSNSGTQSVFYPATYNNGQGQSDNTEAHAPIVLRDSQDYVDFLFLNRRGAIETCSGLTKEAMDIEVETKTYSRVERPSFKPSRSLMTIGTDGRRSWSMSSGYVTREWAEWWTLEFLGGKRKQWWMKYKGPGQATASYVPVIVTPAKQSIGIYDKTKQNMPHVDFTVSLALEG